MYAMDHGVIIIGDFIGRVGASKESNYPIGPNGETTNDKNGQRFSK